MGNAHACIYTAPYRTASVAGLVGVISPPAGQRYSLYGEETGGRCVYACLTVCLHACVCVCACVRRATPPQHDMQGDGARLDIVADGFWGGSRQRAFFDVRVFNPFAQSH